MVAFVAKYIEIINDNKIVVIDDTYLAPKLIARLTIDTNFTRPEDQWAIPMYATWKTTGTHYIKETNTLRELGFDYDDTSEAISEINSTLFVFARSLTGRGLKVTARVSKSGTTGKYVISIKLDSDILGDEAEVCLYSASPKLQPLPYGMAAYNEKGEMVFDALRGVLQNIGTIGGGVNVWQDPAAVYTIDVPTDIKKEDVFISFRSGMPYYSAYKISSGGVSYGDTNYEPIMDMTQKGKIIVRLIRQRYVAGNNSSYGYGGYFENVICCTQPPGIYI